MSVTRSESLSLLALEDAATTDRGPLVVWNHATLSFAARSFGLVDERFRVR